MRWLSVSYFINEKGVSEVHFSAIILPIQPIDYKQLNTQIQGPENSLIVTLPARGWGRNFSGGKGTFKRPLYVAFTI